MPHLTRAAAIGLLLLAGCTPAGPTAPADVTPTPTPTPAPTVSGSDDPAAGASASATPTAAAVTDPTALELQATSCNGGVVLEWSPSIHPDFHHYIALRSSEAEIATQYPPIAPAIDWGDTYATDPYVTSAVDASLIPSEARRWHYRVMAYDAAGRVVGSSPVREARLLPVDDMGDLSVSTASDGTSTLRWKAFGGFSGCFTSYRVVSGAGSVVSVISDLATTELRTTALHPGVAYTLRVEAVRVTTLGSFVAGQTTTLTYTVPGG